MIFWLVLKTSCTLQSSAYSQSRGAMHQNRIPTYLQVSGYSLLLPKTLDFWYRRLTMSPCMSPLIYSCQLSVSDNSFSDGQPSHNENSCGFLCCLWSTSSTYLAYSTLFWSPSIEISWLTHVPRMHLILPLTSMSVTVFRSTQFLKLTVCLPLVLIKLLPNVAKPMALRYHCSQDLPMQQFNL